MKPFTKYDTVIAEEFFYNLYVQFGNTVYWQIVGTHMRTNCVPLIADLFLCCALQFIFGRLSVLICEPTVCLPLHLFLCYA